MPAFQTGCHFVLQLNEVYCLTVKKQACFYTVNPSKPGTYFLQAQSCCIIRYREGKPWPGWLFLGNA